MKTFHVTSRLWSLQLSCKMTYNIAVEEGMFNSFHLLCTANAFWRHCQSQWTQFIIDSEDTLHNYPGELHYWSILTQVPKVIGSKISALSSQAHPWSHQECPPTPTNSWYIAFQYNIQVSKEPLFAHIEKLQSSLTFVIEEALTSEQTAGFLFAHVHTPL